MSRKIPDRWLQYEPVGKQIGSTPFVAFKVPLNDLLLKKVSIEQRFGPDDVIQKLPNLALIIDLTNTTRYYDKDSFIRNGVEYTKISCPGHEIPGRHLLARFFRIVDDFITKNKDKGEICLIGVHCTHGINRTGFFICSYMIQKLGYSPDSAISEFNSARGYDIERQNYINALRQPEVTPSFRSDHGRRSNINDLAPHTNRLPPNNSFDYSDRNSYRQPRYAYSSDVRYSRNYNNDYRNGYYRWPSQNFRQQEFGSTSGEPSSGYNAWRNPNPPRDYNRSYYDRNRRNNN